MKPSFVDSQTFKGGDARIEARSLMLDVRVSSFKRRASIRASTTINVNLILNSMTKWASLPLLTDEALIF